MIARLYGRPLHRESARCVIDVAGVGYEVHATQRALDAWFHAGEAQVEVWVTTQVREDAITLYGFASTADRQAFGALLTVSGVGPKVALATLDALPVGDLVRAVEAGDVLALSRVPGVGKKLAQRLALELKGKISAAPSAALAPGRKRAPDPQDTLPLALERLGYTKAEIARAVDALADAGVDPEAPIAERLRAALKILYAS